MQNVGVTEKSFLLMSLHKYMGCNNYLKTLIFANKTLSILIICWLEGSWMMIQINLDLDIFSCAYVQMLYYVQVCNKVLL